MCEKGRRQSPINIEPDKLVYDPHLRHVHIDKHRVSVRACTSVSVREGERESGRERGRDR